MVGHIILAAPKKNTSLKLRVKIVHLDFTIIAKLKAQLKFTKFTFNNSISWY